MGVFCSTAAGSIDGKIRVWSITDNAVLATAQLHQDMVTAAGFSLDGSRVLAGTMRGRVRFYELADKKLEYVTQVGGCISCGDLQDSTFSHTRRISTT